MFVFSWHTLPSTSLGEALHSYTLFCLAIVTKAKDLQAALCKNALHDEVRDPNKEFSPSILSATLFKSIDYTAHSWKKSSFSQLILFKWAHQDAD